MSSRPTHDDNGMPLPDLYERRPAPEVIREGDTADGPMPVARGADMQDHSARPTHFQRLTKGVAPDNSVLEKYATMSSHLAKVDRRDIQSGHVLRTYYGDEGAQWGRTKHTRIFSLYAMTPAGVALLERVERETPPPVFLRASLRLENIAELQRIPPQAKAWRRLALADANRQAWVMYRRACQCWVDVG